MLLTELHACLCAQLTCHTAHLKYTNKATCCLEHHMLVFAPQLACHAASLEYNNTIATLTRCPNCPAACSSARYLSDPNRQRKRLNTVTGTSHFFAVDAHARSSARGMSGSLGFGGTLALMSCPATSHMHSTWVHMYLYMYMLAHQPGT
eukprot:1142136-Pelagomonas_calceolata.AAC.3